MKKKHKTRLSAQTMCFFSITHPVYTQVFLRTLADVSVSDVFIFRIFLLFNLWARIALRADGCGSLAPLSKIKSGEKGKKKFQQRSFIIKLWSLRISHHREILHLYYCRSMYLAATKPKYLPAIRI